MPFIGPGRADCTSVCSTIMKLLIVFDTVFSRDSTQPRVNLCVVKYIYIYILSLRCMHNDTPGLNLLCDYPGRSDGTSVFVWLLFTVFDTSSKCEATTLLTHFISL